MHYDPEHIKTLLKRLIEDRLSPAEEAELRLALELYTDEEEQHLIYDVGGSASIDENIINQTTLHLPTLENWKARKRKIEIRSVARAVLPYAAVLTIVLLFLLLPRRPQLQTICGGLPGDEIPTGRYSSQLTLANECVIKIDSNYTGQVSVQGDVEIIRTAEGVIEYHQLISFKIPDTSDRMINTLKTGMGQQCQLRLSDGSLIRLNAGSSIRFPVSFNTNERAVIFTGEAFFDIKADTSNPFVIHTTDAKFSVTGTRLNINTYKGNSIATLVSGSMRISTNSDSTILKPGQQAIISSSKTGIDTIVSRQTDTLQFISWKNIQRVYSNVSLKDFVVDMARWHKLEIRCPENIPDRQIGATLCNNSSLSELFNLFHKMELKFSVEGRMIVFSKT